jgi:hypothetical protein
MVYYDEDHYSEPSAEQRQRVAEGGVELFVMEGDHMSFMSDPARAFGRFVLVSHNFANLRPKVSGLAAQKSRQVQPASSTLVLSEQPAT